MIENGSAVTLTKFPPNRSMMDWDRILHITQHGYVVETVQERKKTLYLVWFSSRNRNEGWEVWLTTEHFSLAPKKRKHDV